MLISADLSYILKQNKKILYLLILIFNNILLIKGRVSLVFY